MNPLLLAKLIKKNLLLFLKADTMRGTSEGIRVEPIPT
jgi:hypothetical protein